MNRKRKINFLKNPASKKAVIAVAVITLVFAALGTVYLNYAYKKQRNRVDNEALWLLSSAAAFLDIEEVEALASEGTESPSTNEILSRLASARSWACATYLLGYKNGALEVLAHTGEETVSLSGPDGVVIVEAESAPFSNGEKTVVFKRGTDKWVKMLVPVYDQSGENVIAVMGMACLASELKTYLWHKMVPDILLTVFVIIIAVFLVDMTRKHVMLRVTAARLASQEALYRNIFEQSPIGIILNSNRSSPDGNEFVSLNPTGEKILGIKYEDIKNIDWRKITHPDDLERELPLFEKFARGQTDSYSIEKRIFKPDGSFAWANVIISALKKNPLYKSMYVCLIQDITKRKQSEESLKESERSKSVFFSHLPGMAYRCRNDEDWTMEFISKGCYELTGYKPESFINNRDISYNEVIAPAYHEILRAEWEKVFLTGKHFHYEYEIITKSGERKWVLERGRPIYDDEGNVEVLEGIILDISEQRKKEAQIAYLQEHDFLTGLYNRNRMSQEQKRLDSPEFLPVSVAVCDIDGLRVINDAFGYDEGDWLIQKTTHLIQSCLGGEYAMSHEGGGKFYLFLPNTDSEAAYKLKNDIICAIDSYNRANVNALYTISLSIGYGIKEREEQKLSDTVREAEAYLERGKLLSRNSSHSAIVSAIMAALYAKSQETEQHGQRMELISQMIGEKVGLNQKDLDALRLLSKLHDIGKISIDDSILNKPSKLTESEWKIMKQHPEIGYRIAKSTPQLEHIAEYILAHHERWDGKGYPAGLKGEQIPIVSRILSIADAFDAMTEDRIYRKALSYEAAIEEIKRNAGTQFDPAIAKVFVELVSTWDNKKPGPAELK